MDFTLAKKQILEILDLRLKKKKVVINKFKYAHTHTKSLVNYALRDDLTPHRIQVFKKALDIIEAHYSTTKHDEEMPEEVRKQLEGLFAQDHMDKIDQNITK